jgi:hypothetical protein
LSKSVAPARGRDSTRDRSTDPIFCRRNSIFRSSWIGQHSFALRPPRDAQWASFTMTLTRTRSQPQRSTSSMGNAPSLTAAEIRTGTGRSRSRSRSRRRTLPSLPRAFTPGEYVDDEFKHPARGESQTPQDRESTWTQRIGSGDADVYDRPGHQDDPTKHQGRTRSRPFVEGEYNAHLYITRESLSPPRHSLWIGCASSMSSCLFQSFCRKRYMMS